MIGLTGVMKCKYFDQINTVAGELLKMAVSKIDWSQVQILSSCCMALELEKKLSQEKHTKLMKGKSNLVFSSLGL